MRHVVMFSGGVGSYAPAKRVAVRKGDDLVLLFADTKMEDDDLYRFLDESAADIGGRLVRESDGRTPWEVFTDVRFLGNTRVDPCSRILKRELLRLWLEENCAASDTTVYLGIDWTEAHRFVRAAKHWAPWRVEAPLCEAPYLTRADHIAALSERGIAAPRLYGMGFPHNNCGGFCVKAGQAHFALLLKTMPERYAFHEGKEEALRDYLQKDVAIMKDRVGGKTTPLTMRVFRERLQEQPDLFDVHEWGGCSCFGADDDATGGGE